MPRARRPIELRGTAVSGGTALKEGSMIQGTLLPLRGGRSRSSVRATIARLSVVVAACLFVSVLVVRETRSAFTASTANSGNSFTTGTVSITDDDAGAAMFSVTGMQPGDTARGCITVTYTGSLDAAVRIHAAATTAALAPYLDLTVKEGSLSGGSDCATNFVAGDTIFAPGTVGSFLAAHTDWSNGLDADAGGWNPAGGSGEAKTFQFTVTLQDDNAAQGASVTGLAFTWEAQSV
jgi:hypothetical protein